MQIKTINVAKEFYHRLANSTKKRGDGKYTAKQFRKKYLKQFDNKEAWENKSKGIILDFSDVSKISPSFANKAFSYFNKYAIPNEILNKIEFINIHPVKLAIIAMEINSGYDG